MVLDFHDPLAAEAVGHYRELVERALPTIRSVVLIVGLGRHSKGGRGVLRKVIEGLIAAMPGVRATAVPGNDGRLEVTLGRGTPLHEGRPLHAWQRLGSGSTAAPSAK